MRPLILNLVSFSIAFGKGSRVLGASLEQSEQHQVVLRGNPGIPVQRDIFGRTSKLGYYRLPQNNIPFS